MTKLRGTSIALFLALAAFALAACGGDDNGGNNESAAGTDATEATTGTTDATTGTETGSTESRERDRTQTGERKTDDKGGSGGGGGGSDDSGKSGSGGSGSGGSGGSGSGSGGSGGGNKRKSSSPENQLTNKNVESTSKTVCSQFLPTAIERDLKDGKKSEQDVAKDYSLAYPPGERKSAYDGCLAGLKSRG
jgi:hypothetical protein